MKRHSGFTIIELLIVLAVIGIITAIAYPSYTGYVLSARRADAKASLTAFANAMEQFRTVNRTYVGAGVGGATTGAPDPSVFSDRAPVSGTKSYDLSIQSADGNTFTLSAAPVQADAGCGTLTLDQDGVGTPASCW